MSKAKKPPKLSRQHRTDFEYIQMNIPSAEDLKKTSPSQCRFLLGMIRDLVNNRLEAEA